MFCTAFLYFYLLLRYKPIWMYIKLLWMRGKIACVRVIVLCMYMYTSIFFFYKNKNNKINKKNFRKPFYVNLFP